jgi:hypothetical protein
MQQWRFGRGMYRLIAILIVTTALITLGCSSDDDDEEVVNDPAEQARTLAGRTIEFDASFIDPALAGQQAVLVFGAATGNTVTFTLTIGGTTRLEGTATLASIDLLFQRIFVNDVLDADGVVTINGVVFQTGPNGVLRFDIEIVIEPDGTVTITMANPRTGAELVAVFEPGQTGTTGTTGSPGGPGGVQP